MAPTKTNPPAMGVARGAQDSTSGSHSSALPSHNAAIKAGLLNSRYKCTVVVAERAIFQQLLPGLVNEDARRAVTFATQLGAGFVVVAGQLHKAKAGCFATLIPDPANLDALELSAAAAFARLTELGETDSVWIIAVEGEPASASMPWLHAVGDGGHSMITLTKYTAHRPTRLSKSSRSSMGSW